MNYKVLYRKYRPSTFDEVYGQNSSVSLLKDAIINDKISHAYIFSGPRGTGKTSCAKLFAKAVNCLNNNDGSPCNKCDVCNINNTDIYEIDAASNNGVDQIREIVDNIKLSPVNSKYKVYIIDEVHMLSNSAFNALLLTLEEPPSHVIFILATTNIEAVPITVLSRCQRISFKKISDKEIYDNIERICKIEKIKISKDAIEEITQSSNGGMRDALSILDQLSKNDKEITLDDVLNNIGIVSNHKIKELIDEINNNNIKFIQGFIKSIEENAIDYKSVIKKIIEECKVRSIEIKENDRIDRLLFTDYKNLVNELASTIYKANVNIDSYTLLELILLDYVQLSVVNENKKNKKEDHKEISKEESILEKTKTKSANNIIKVRINNCFINANKKHLNSSKEKWSDFIKKCTNKRLLGKIIDSTIVLSSDEIIVLVSDIKENVDIINENLDNIEREYKKYTNEEIKFICTDETNWNKEIELYKQNIKNGVKYEYMDEIKEEDNTSLNGLFSKSKIEVK